MGVELVVDAGELERDSPLVVARIPPEALAKAGVRVALGAGPVGDEVEGGACLLREANGAGTPVEAIAQYDPAARTLAFVVPGRLAPGSQRRFRVVAGAPPRGAAYPVRLLQKLDRVIIHVAGEPFATYNVLGARRPYFWPVLGPAGASLVRGQGTGEHPHHTGMGLNYGGHSEGGSTNIWSDWDEPPYGPGGRMLHRGFRRLASGPVYGEIVQDLTYVNAYGDPIVDEIRTIRCWWASPSARFFDFEFNVLRAEDRGPQPFLFMIRLTGSFDIPHTGRVTNAAGYPVPAPEGMERYFRAAWIDAAGPTGEPPPPPPAAPPETLVDLPGAPRRRAGPGTGPWNGIALFDHPENDQFPGLIGKYAGMRGAVQITQVHYPPPHAPHGPFTFRHRVYVHDGDAAAGGVAARAADYAQPCAVAVRETED